VLDNNVHLYGLSVDAASGGNWVEISRIEAHTTTQHLRPTPSMTTPRMQYTPSTFEANIQNRSNVLPPTSQAAVKAETAARAEARGGCHTDDRHDKVVNNEGLHTSYVELWQETHTIKAGTVNSQADIVQRTLGDALDCVRHCPFRLSCIINTLFFFLTDHYA
jgi:hypothetical protein